MSLLQDDVLEASYHEPKLAFPQQAGTILQQLLLTPLNRRTGRRMALVLAAQNDPALTTCTDLTRPVLTLPLPNFARLLTSFPSSPDGRESHSPGAPRLPAVLLLRARQHFFPRSFLI